MIPAVIKRKRSTLKIAFVFGLIAVLTMPPVVNVFIGSANAGMFTDANVKVNNSQAAATGVSYNFRFSATATTAIEQVNIKFCTTPGAYADACTAPTGMVTTGAALANDTIAGTGRVNDFTTNGTLETDITTAASQATAAMEYNVTGITNPSAVNTSFYARIITYSDAGTTEIDSVTVAAAVLDTDSIAVSATIDQSFSFSVAGVTTGGSFNGGTGNINVTTTANTIPFDTLAVDTEKIAAHDITITTNAPNGYTVTASHSASAVSGNPPLISGTDNVDSFTGSNTTPATWSAPSGTTANANTGFFGYSTEDASLCTGTANRFTSGGAKWAGSTTTGEEIVCSATGVNAETVRVGWQVEVNDIQPGGSYAGTTVLIATPTY